jgi:hypothetical protein
MPTWAFVLLRVVLAAAFTVVLAWVAWKAGGREWMFLSFLLSAPFIAAALARPILEGSTEAMRWLAQRWHTRWEGKYYEFSGVQVRIFEHRDQLWFAVADIIRAIGKGKGADGLLETYSKGGRIVPEAKMLCLTIAGLEKNLDPAEAPDIGRFLVWARRDVVTPWERKRSGELIPR